MIFTLIKNELIKIFHRGKTWIVFVLFSLLVFGAIGINYKSAKNSEYYYSPQGQIEQFNKQIEWANQNIKSLEGSTESWAEEEIASSRLSIEHSNEQIKKQEELLKISSNEELWKTKLTNEKEEIENSLKNEEIDAEAKEHYMTRLDEINYYLNNNEKPIEGWEFNAFNYGEELIGLLGLIILVSGIAVFMSDIVSGECTPATLKFLLVQPISRGKVILSKFVAVVMTVVGMIGSLELLAFGIVGAIGGFGGAKIPMVIGKTFKWDYSNLNYSGAASLVEVSNSGFSVTKSEAMIQSFLLQILFIVACCAFVFLISSIFKSSMTTMAISVIISVASTMICMMSEKMGQYAHLNFLNYGNTFSVLKGEVAYTFQNPNLTVSLGIGLMVGTIIISYIISHFVFSKKDILI